MEITISNGTSVESSPRDTLKSLDWTSKKLLHLSSESNRYDVSSPTQPTKDWIYSTSIAKLPFSMVPVTSNSTCSNLKDLSTNGTLAKFFDSINHCTASSKHPEFGICSSAALLHLSASSLSN